MRNIKRIANILENPEVSNNEKQLSVSVLRAIKIRARKALIRDKDASEEAKWANMDFNELSNYVYNNFEKVRAKIPNNPYNQASAAIEILKSVAEIEKFTLKDGNDNLVI